MKKKATLGYRIRTCMMVNTLNATGLIFGLYLLGVAADQQDDWRDRVDHSDTFQVEVVPDKKKEARR